MRTMLTPTRVHFELDTTPFTGRESGSRKVSSSLTPFSGVGNERAVDAAAPDLRLYQNAEHQRVPGDDSTLLLPALSSSSPSTQTYFAGGLRRSARFYNIAGPSRTPGNSARTNGYNAITKSSSSGSFPQKQTFIRVRKRREIVVCIGLLAYSAMHVSSDICNKRTYKTDIFILLQNIYTALMKVP